jgi:hypothetical protein
MASKLGVSVHLLCTLPHRISNLKKIECQALPAAPETPFESRVPREVETKITRWVRFQYTEELGDMQVWFIDIIILETRVTQNS